MVKSRKLKGGSVCNSMPNVSVYNSPCSGLPLDSNFQQQFINDSMQNNLQSGGGYFLDIGNTNPINPMDAPVQGYSECCPPVFDTAVGSTNLVDNSSLSNASGTNSTLFNDSGFAINSNGSPLCGGGKKGDNGSRRTKKDKAKNTKSRGYSGKQTRRLEEKLKSQMEKKKLRTPKKKSSKGKKSKKGGRRKRQRGGQNSVFSGNMLNRTFNCSQPHWNASCI